MGLCGPTAATKQPRNERLPAAPGLRLCPGGDWHIPVLCAGIWTLARCTDALSPLSRLAVAATRGANGGGRLRRGATEFGLIWSLVGTRKS